MERQAVKSKRRFMGILTRECVKQLGIMIATHSSGKCSIETVVRTDNRYAVISCVAMNVRVFSSENDWLIALWEILLSNEQGLLFSFGVYRARNCMKAPFYALLLERYML